MLLVASWSTGAALAAGGGGGHGSDEGAAYVRVPQISVTLFDGDEPRGIISAVVLLEVSGDESREHLLTNMPRLKDAFMRALYQLGEAEARLQGEYGPSEIKRALQLVSDHLLGAGVVDEVLLEGVTRSGGS